MQVADPLDALVVPVSGGGMISGIAVAAKHLQPDIKIYAAEPAGEFSRLGTRRCMSHGPGLAASAGALHRTLPHMTNGQHKGIKIRSILAVKQCKREHAMRPALIVSYLPEVHGQNLDNLHVAEASADQSHPYG